MSLIQLAERRWLPDSLIRIGMRRLLRQRLAQSREEAADGKELAVDRFARRMRESDVTIETKAANEQHYEVPAEFYLRVLGSRLKYSCGLWDESNWQNAAVTLDSSEEAMLNLTCRRAEISDGMKILELGCGWGSLTLWMAEKFPRAEITALSNSASQRAFIMQRAQSRGLSNVNVITADVGQFQIDGQFDRVVSVEMFEHVRNHDTLLSRIAGWLKPEGALFVHIFCHREFAYTFETDGEKNWMGRHFFSGGIMPAENLFRRFDDHMVVDDQWWIDGRHYALTCEAWLKKLDACHAEAARILSADRTDEPAKVLVQRWRMFFMACAELFAFDGGQQWGVGHYLFRKAPSSQ